MSVIRLAILGSTRGTGMLPIIAAIQDKSLSASIEIVMSNKPDALILERAQKHKLLARYINPDGLTREDFDKQISDLLKLLHVDLIVLIGFMRILSPDFVNTWRNKIINVHPSLLPAFAGGMNADVHEAVLRSGVTESGCTVHYVTEAVDAGRIIIQKKCYVLADDTIETLKNRIQLLEGQALIEAIQIAVSKQTNTA